MSVWTALAFVLPPSIAWAIGKWAEAWASTYQDSESGDDV